MTLTQRRRPTIMWNGGSSPNIYRFVPASKKACETSTFGSDDIHQYALLLYNGQNAQVKRKYEILVYKIDISLHAT